MKNKANSFANLWDKCGSSQNLGRPKYSLDNICSYAPDAELGQDFDVLCSVNDAKIFLPQKRSPWPSILLKVGGHDGDYGNMVCQVSKGGIQKLDPFCEVIYLVNYLTFLVKNVILKGNYYILWISSAEQSWIGQHLKNEVFQKLNVLITSYY